MTHVTKMCHNAFTVNRDNEPSFAGDEVRVDIFDDDELVQIATRTCPASLPHDPILQVCHAR